MKDNNIIYLATEKDKLGLDVKVKKAVTMGTTPIVPLFMKEYANLMSRGYTSNNMIATNKSKVLFVEIDDIIAGFIVYDIHHDEVSKTCWILFGTVLEAFRRRGLYAIMHKHLEMVAKEQGSKQIFSLVHVDNTAMLNLNKKLNKNPVYYRMEKYL
jgi:ribosomal protein S18 acetylase RimI-like enzyme